MTTVTIQRERRTYEPDSRYSFLMDTIRGGLLHDEDALHRLQKHTDEQRVDATNRAERAPEGVEYERRVNPNVTAGTGGEFAPPIWYPEMYASAERAGRPFADLLPKVPLPRGVAQINVPRVLDGGTITDPDVDGTPIDSKDITTSDTSSQVLSLSGAQVVSQQLLDLTPSGFDSLIWPEIQKAYNLALEQQLMTGAGGATGLLGLSNIVPAANSISGSGVATTTTNGVQVLWPLLGQAAAAVGNNRGQPPEVWLMSPRRWFFIAASLDGQNRPVGQPGNVPDRTGDGAAGGALPMGPVLGLPVYADGALNGATAAVADTLYCVRPSDSLLFEGTPTVQVAPEPTSGTLQVRLTFRNYVASVLNRYPDSIAAVTSMPQPTGF